MIIYNIRRNGPYEKDKLILNVGQLHNLVCDQKEKFGPDRKIYKQLDYIGKILNNIYDMDSNNGANQIFLRMLKARVG